MVISYAHSSEFGDQCRAKTHRVRPLAAENDCRFLASSGKLYHGLDSVEGAIGSVDYVGSVGIGLDNEGAGREKTGADVPDGLFGCRGSESQNLMRMQADHNIGQGAVCRTEFLAPLGNDVGFVHHKKADAAFA